MGLDREVGADILRCVIESLVAAGVPSKRRKVVYSLLFGVWEDAGFDSFEDLLGLDEIVDKAFEAAYEEEYG